MEQVTTTVPRRNALSRITFQWRRRVAACFEHSLYALQCDALAVNTCRDLFIGIHGRNHIGGQNLLVVRVDSPNDVCNKETQVGQLKNLLKGALQQRADTALKARAG